MTIAKLFKFNSKIETCTKEREKKQIKMMEGQMEKVSYRADDQYHKYVINNKITKPFKK